MYISYRPSLKMGAQMGMMSMFPFTHANRSFWQGGAQAIYQGARALGLTVGDVVLVPAYSCGSECDPLLKLGLQVHYYHILPTLIPDFEHLVQLCEALSPKALLVTHFFGLPQPMQQVMAFAQEHDLWLIEDNAHGLYGVDEGERPLGSFGDVAVFSLAKSLPLPDGGVLVVNGPHSVGVGKQPHPFKTLTATVGVAKDGVMAAVSQRWPAVGAKINGRLLDRMSARWLRLEERFAGEGTPSFEQGLVELKRKRADWRMSGISRWLLRHQPHEMIRERRRHNFRYLLQNFPQREGVKPLFRALPVGCCPLAFPVQATTPEQAEALAQYLRNHHVIAYRWWSQFHEHLPTTDFPFESTLKQTVVALPIHQDLDETHLQYLLKVMGSSFL